MKRLVHKLRRKHVLHWWDERGWFRTHTMFFRGTDRVMKIFNRHCRLCPKVQEKSHWAEYPTGR
jgi:hypothetical protein